VYGQWSNHAWSLYYAELRDGVVHATYDPRCPWCTQRRSTGHHYTCDRPGLVPMEREEQVFGSWVNR
jgi:hypothetical protein